jgi:hypothetical protein
VAGSSDQESAIEQARASRLPAAMASTQAQVKGKITLSNLTLVDNAGKPIPGNSTSTLSVRVIDPGDDILSVSAGNADNQGQFALTLDSVARRRFLLEVSGNVQEDLNGDGIAGDRLLQRFPVTVLAGRVSTLKIALKLQSGLQPAAPATPGVAPPPVLVASVDALDTDGHRTNSIASDYRDTQVVVDLDGDGVFDPLRDGTLDDKDHDGLPDSLLAMYERTDSYSSAYGLITAVDQSQHTVQLLVKSGNDVHSLRVKIDPFAATELYLPNAPGSDPFALIGFGQFLTGHYAWVDGYFTDAPTNAQFNALIATVL